MKANPPMNSIQQKSTELLSVFGGKYGLAGANMLTALKNTYFKAAKGEEPLNDGELMAACSVCNKYGLDPFLREVHCTRAGGRLLIMVGLDGWIRQCQSNPMYDGMDPPLYEFDESGKPMSCTTTIYRKDQSHPTSYTAFLSEWVKNSPPWQVQPRHMLYVKSLKNCIRLAFGISGLDTEDTSDFADIPMVRMPQRQALPQPVQPVSTPEDDPFSNPQEEREPGSEG
jgi:hypothetical protein